MTFMALEKAQAELLAERSEHGDSSSATWRTQCTAVFGSQPIIVARR